MLKFFVILFLTFGLALTSGCSSGSSEGEDVAAVDAPQDGEEVVEEVEEIIDGDGDEYEIVEEEVISDDGAEEYVTEEGGFPEEVTDSGEMADTEVVEDETIIPNEDGDGTSFEGEAGSEEASTEETYGEESYAGEDSGFGSESYSESYAGSEDVPSETVVQDPPKKTYVPVKKIAEVPWDKHGYNANSVYLVRSGDTMDDISAKIYGNAGRADELYAINPNLKRGMKVGDKVYYTSPNRPNDQNSLLTFYEDNGVPPLYYTAQKGENIREISKNLLGHERSWMEIWATNPEVESKWALSQGAELRYWPNDVAVGGPIDPDYSPGVGDAGMGSDSMSGNNGTGSDSSSAMDSSNNSAMNSSVNSAANSGSTMDSGMEEPTSKAADGASLEPMDEGESESMAMPEPMDDVESLPVELPAKAEMNSANSSDSGSTDMGEMPSAQGDLPPPPPPIETGEPQEVADLGVGNTVSNDIPPPPPVEPIGTPTPEESVAPPPPPPAPKREQRKPRPKKAKATGGGVEDFLADEFNLMLIAGVLFILVAGALVVIRKKRQSKRINLGETQV